MSQSKETKPQKKPTDAELSIMGVIWDRGPSTVREVFDHLREKQEIGYTTVLKFMQIMTEKGLLVRDTSVRPQIFSASQPRKKTQRQILKDLLDRAFGASPGNLVLQALSVKKPSAEERAAIRDLLDRMEGQGDELDGVDGLDGLDEEVDDD